MTNQNVVVPEAMGIAAATAVAKRRPIFTYLLPKGGGGGGDGFGLRRKCLPQLELGGIGGSGRINVWLETMKASSPTHAKTVAAVYCAAPSVAEEGEHMTWMMRHPSALSMFDEITRAAKGKQIVMFLDYDGTLSPIVNDPELAFMSDAMRYAVRDVARYFPTAIVSGRCRNKVYNFVRLAELYYAGSHGMDIKVPAKGPSFKKARKAVLFQPASKFLPMIEKAYKTLLEVAKSTPGAKVENNKFCVSVHFRCVDEKRWRALADRVKSVMKEYPKLQLTPGRKVLEIRPIIKWDKGRAMEFLLESLGYADCDDVLPVYIGDDLSDEDAFKVLRNRRQGFGILVSKVPKETSASYSLQEPSEVMDFLQRLVEWKRLTLESCAVE